MSKLTLEQGKKLIKIARESITSYFKNKNFNIKSLEKKNGVFVTLHSYPKKDLRGCIGMIQPIMPLDKAVASLARSSAFQDNRFKPLDEKEKYVIELSVLTKPKLIESKDYFKEIKIGRDGLILEFGLFGGVLLPQVPVEQGWNVEEFLNHLCLKSNLPPLIWKDPRCKIYKFEAQIFYELGPDGKVIEKL